MKSMYQLMKEASQHLENAVAKTKSKRYGVDDVIKKLPPEDRGDYLAKLRQEKKAASKWPGVGKDPTANHEFVQWLLDDPSSGVKLASMRPPREAVRAFLKQNPKPTDDEVHKWAKENGWDRDHTERVFYEMASEHVREHGG